MGQEFCLQAGGKPTDSQRPDDSSAQGELNTCELVQFISGMTTVGDKIVMSYGVNDCEGKLWSIKISDVLDMLLAPKS
jgi:hypothetical protein